jgi:hypothetical protein
VIWRDFAAALVLCGEMEGDDDVSVIVEQNR